MEKKIETILKAISFARDGVKLPDEDANKATKALAEIVAAQQSRKTSVDRSDPIHKDWDTPEEDEAWEGL